MSYFNYHAAAKRLIREGKLKEWICHIARNTSINYVTRNKHKDVIKDEEIVSLKSSNDNSHRSMLELFEEHLDDDKRKLKEI